MRAAPVAQGTTTLIRLPNVSRSYVLTGTERGMEETFGSTCHGAGRQRSRNNSRTKIEYTDVLEGLKTKGIAIRVASPKVMCTRAGGACGGAGAGPPPVSNGTPLPAVGDGGGTRVVQGCVRRGRHVPRGGHQQKVLQAAPDRGRQGLKSAVR